MNLYKCTYESDAEMQKLVSLPSPLLSILDAKLTVSPNKQYFGMVKPTTPPATGPLCIPIRIRITSVGKCGMRNRFIA